MTGQHQKARELRDPGALFIAAIVGLASATSLLAAYDQLVAQPARKREAVSDSVLDEIALHRCAVILSPRCIEWRTPH